jgi:hypothetical protein
MMLIEAVGIFSVAAVSGAAARLYVCHPVRVRTQHAKECLRVHGPSSDFDIVWLLENAVAIGPEFLKLKKKVLERGSLDDFVFYFNF